MYGLTSRESLSQRQSRWFQQCNPFTTALSNEYTKHQSPSIITIINTEHSVTDTESSDDILISQDDDSYLDIKSETPNINNISTDSNILHVDRLNILESTSNDINDIVNRLIILENISTDNILYVDRLNVLESTSNDINDRLNILESTSNSIINIVDRLNALESAFANMSKLYNTITDLEGKIKDLEEKHNGVFCMENKEASNEFIPFYVKEDYTARDNYTKLDGNKFKIYIEIIGFSTDRQIIYPFGDEKVSVNFKDDNIKLTFTDQNKISGTLVSSLKRNDDNIYILELTEDNIKVMKTLSTPIILSCETELNIEE